MSQLCQLSQLGQLSRLSWLSLSREPPGVHGWQRRHACTLSGQRGAAPIWTSVPRPDQSSSPALVHSDARIEKNSFDTGPGPIFWLSDISDVVITANAITYCSKAVIYPSGGVLNTSNAHGVELRDDKLQAVDSPRLCVK